MSGPSLVEIDPIALGPFEIARIPLSGAIGAAGFLLSLGLAVRRLRAAGLPPLLGMELHAAGAPLVLLASRVPALARGFPAFLHDADVLSGALTSRGSVTLGAIAGLAVLLAFAWASRRPVPFLDALAPGAIVIGAAVAAAHAAGSRAALLAAAGALLAAALLAAAAPRRPGVAAALAAGTLAVLASLAAWAG